MPPQVEPKHMQISLNPAPLGTVQSNVPGQVTPELEPESPGPVLPFLGLISLVQLGSSGTICMNPSLSLFFRVREFLG